MIRIHYPDQNYYDVMPSDDSNGYVELMGEDYVELKFATPTYVEIPVGSYITFSDKLYYINMPQDIKIINRRNYEYTVRFEAVSAVWKYRPFINPDDGRVTFQVTGNLSEHVNLLIRSARMYSGGNWVAGTIASISDEKCISYDGISLRDALVLIADEFGMEFEFDHLTVNVCKVEYNASSPISLQYGKNNGLVSGIQRMNYSKGPELIGYAVRSSSQNLNTSSNQNVSYGDKTLHMPDKLVPPAYPSFELPMIIGYDGSKFAYSKNFNAEGSSQYYIYEEETGFDENKAKYYYIPVGDGHAIYYAGTEKLFPEPLYLSKYNGVRIDVLDLTNIYPTVTHTVTNVTTRTVTDDNNEQYTEYSVYVADNINYNDLQIPGTNAITIVFQTGALAGKEFDVNYNHANRKFTIVSKFIDDERMPQGSYFIPAQGDTFKVFNCMLPDDYIRKDSDHTGAEWDLAREAVRQLWDNMHVQYKWKFDVDGIYAAGLTDSEFAKFRIGGYVSFTDPAVQVNAVEIRIMSIKQPLNHPRWITVTIADRQEIHKRLIAGLQAMSEFGVNNINTSTEINDEAQRRSTGISNANLRINTTNGNVTTLATRVTGVEGDVAALPTYADAYSALEDKGGPVLVDAKKCQSLKYLEFTREYASASKSIVLNSSYAGIETSVIISNNSGTDVTLSVTAKNGEAIVFNTADKNDQVLDGCVRKLTYWLTGRTYYVTMTDII
jgi:hypothetical protein